MFTLYSEGVDTVRSWPSWLTARRTNSARRAAARERPAGIHEGRIAGEETVEVYYRELHAMSSRERKHVYREMERAVAAQRPSWLGRVWAVARHLGIRAGAPR
jgi:hypothetical protein